MRMLCCLIKIKSDHRPTKLYMKKKKSKTTVTEEAHKKNCMARNCSGLTISFGIFCAYGPYNIVHIEDITTC